MKKRKIMALLMAVVMSASAVGITACSDKKSKDKKKDRDEEETETEEVVETEIPETTVPETVPVEETVVTEPVIDVDIAIGDSENENNEADAKAYALFMDFVKNGSFDSDAQFAFENFRYGQDDHVDCRWGLVVTTGDDSVAYAVVDGKVVESDLGHDWYPDYGAPKDVFLQLPIMIEIDASEIISVDDVADGTYYGSLYCMNEAGTEALVCIGLPLVIDAATYNKLDSVDSFTDIDGDTFTIMGTYDNDLDLMDDSGNWIYGRFSSREDGNYILTSDSDYIPFHNANYVFIDISQDCEIEDHYVWLVGDGGSDPFVGVNPDEPLTMTNSHFYELFYTYSFANSYNGWLAGQSSILEPVEIKDGEIVKVVLGWR